MNCPFIRYAIVRNADSRRQVEAYLPSNYRIIHEAPGYLMIDNKPKLVFVIAGKDDAGWTLDGYIQPRFASGLIWCEEIDLSHPIMKEVPINA